MVTYNKNKFLLVHILFVLLLVVFSNAQFSTKITKSEVNDICRHEETNTTFCFEFLNSSPEIAKLDFSGLAKFLINYNSRKISVMLKQFQSLEKKHN
ncbi:unnamed protein product [Arabidopsis halleri]